MVGESVIAEAIGGLLKVFLVLVFLETRCDCPGVVCDFNTPIRHAKAPVASAIAAVVRACLTIALDGCSCFSDSDLSTIGRPRGMEWTQ